MNKSNTNAAETSEVTQSTINHAGREYKILASVHGNREFVTICRGLRASGWEHLDLSDGNHAGTPIVAEANRIHDESGHLPVVFAAPK